MSPSLAAWTGPTILTAALLASPVAAAEPAASDPVEALRDLLRRPTDDDLARTAALTPTADLLRSPGELGRALLLEEWQDDDPKHRAARADVEVREKLLTRFEEQVRTALASSDPTTRQAAATLVGDMAVRARAGGGAFDAAAVRGRALVRERLSDLAPDLIRLAEDDALEVRTAALRSLGRIQPEPRRVVRALAVVLAANEMKQETAVRLAAAAALDELMETAEWDWKQPRRTDVERESADGDLIFVAALVVPAAAGGLDDGDRQVRRDCTRAARRTAEALLDLVPEPALAAARESNEDAQLRREKQREKLKPLLDALNRLLPDLAKRGEDQPAVRESALLALRAAAVVRRRLRSGTLPKYDDPLPGLVPAGLLVRDALTNDDRAVRLAALTVMQEIGSAGPNLGWRVTRLLRNDSDPTVRLAAVRTLTAIGPGDYADDVIAGLIKVLEDPNSDVRQAAAEALAVYAPRATPEVVRALTRAVQRPDGPRLAALRALATIGAGTPDAAPVVIDALDDPDAAVRAAAAVALGRFGPPDRAARKALRKALDDPDAGVRLAAAEALLAGK